MYTVYTIIYTVKDRIPVYNDEVVNSGDFCTPWQEQ